MPTHDDDDIEDFQVKDSNGNILNEGDSVHLIKDLKTSI